MLICQSRNRSYADSKKVKAISKMQIGTIVSFSTKAPPETKQNQFIFLKFSWLSA